MPFEFLIITCKMLDGTGNSVFSHTFQLCCRHGAGEVRIFGKILKITSVQRIPVNINTGTQKTVDLVLAKLHALHLIQFFHQLRIKGTCQQRTVRQCIGHGTAVHTDAGRTIGTAGHRNTELLQSIRHTAESCCCSGGNFRGTHAFSSGHADQIFV